MRAVAQRVRSARVTVAGDEIFRMGEGLLALVGVGRRDEPEDARDLARRLVQLRVFADDAGRMSRTLLEAGGSLGVVSQFTLLGDARQGRRPSWAEAAPAERAQPLLEVLVEAARGLGAPVSTGSFGATMEVELVNTGPVTVLLDTEKRF